MEIDAKLVATLRERTGAGIMDAKTALVETQGDVAAAADLLRTKGVLKAAKKSERATGEGLVYSYIHGGGKIGVLLELQCETDFVARTDAFRDLAHQLAMHIAAADPKYLDLAGIPTADAEHEKNLVAETLRAEGKPEAMLEKILEGKMSKFYAENVLLKQPFVMDEEKTIEGLLAQAVATIGENMRLTRFARFNIKGGMTACGVPPVEATQV